MCNDRSQFSNFQSFLTTATISNILGMKIGGKGDIKITTKAGNNFTLLNVLYVPQLTSNLLSISCAKKNPTICFKFTKSQCKILHGKNILATAISLDSNFIMETILVSRQSVNDTKPYT